MAMKTLEVFELCFTGMVEHHLASFLLLHHSIEGCFAGVWMLFARMMLDVSPGSFVGDFQQLVPL